MTRRFCVTLEKQIKPQCSVTGIYLHGAPHAEGGQGCKMSRRSLRVRGEHIVVPTIDPTVAQIWMHYLSYGVMAEEVWSLVELSMLTRMVPVSLHSSQLLVLEASVNFYLTPLIKMLLYQKRSTSRDRCIESDRLPDPLQGLWQRP